MSAGKKFIKAYEGKFKEDLKASYEALKANMPAEMVETIVGDMIRFELPLKVYPKTYNKQPLMYAGLSARKSNLAMTLTGIYNDEVLKEGFINSAGEKTPKLKTATSCLKFKKAEELPLGEIKKLTKRLNTKRFLKNYEALMKRMGR